MRGSGVSAYVSACVRSSGALCVVCRGMCVRSRALYVISMLYPALSFL